MRKHRTELVEVRLRDDACTEERLVNRVVELGLVHRLVEGCLGSDTGDLDRLHYAINHHLLLGIGCHLAIDDQVKQARR